MPLLRTESPDASTKVGIWKIEESVAELKRLARLSSGEEEQFNTFGSEKRKRQWLSYHILLNDLVSPPPSLEYDVYGKPSLKGSTVHLSISHSGDYSVVILSRNHPVGIDIERVTGRIERIRSRFLSEEEDLRIGNDNRLDKLYVAWGAKESLYKIYGKPEVELQRDIFIDSFDYLCTAKGRCRGSMNTPEGRETYTIFYEKIAGYMLVYAFRSDTGND